MKPPILVLLGLAVVIPACGGGTLEQTQTDTKTPTPEPAAAPEAPAMTQAELDTALWDAATGGLGDPEQIAGLIAQGANPNQTKDFLGEFIPLLQQAAREAGPDAIKALEDGGADWTQLTSDQLGWALLDASCTGNSYTVSALVKAGADPNYSNEFDETPALMLSPSQSHACSPQDPEAIRQVLQDAGADIPQAGDEGGDPALALADVELG